MLNLSRGSRSGVGCGAGYGIGLVLAIAIWLQPACARAVLMNYTGTLSMNIEGFSNSSQPFHGTADVDLSTGAFQILNGWSTIPTTSGSYVTSVAIRPPQQMTTTPSGSWLTAVTRHPIAQHPLLSVGGFSKGSLLIHQAIAMDIWSSSGNLFFHPNGGFGGGFGGNALLNATGNTGTLVAADFAASPVTLSGLYKHTVFMEAGRRTWGATNTTYRAYTVVRHRNSPSPSFSSFSAPGIPVPNWTANNASFTIDGRPYTASGYDNRTATNRTGQILLVTPMRIYAGMPNGGIGGFFSLDLDFTPVPEPGTALLLGAGLVSLALAGRSRRARD